MYDISETMYFKVLVIYVIILIINSTGTVFVSRITYIREHFICDLSNSMVLAK